VKKIYIIMFFLLVVNFIGAISRFNVPITRLVQSKKRALISPPKTGTHLTLKVFEFIDPKNRTHITPPELYLINDSIMNSFLKKPVFLSTHAIYCDQNRKHLNKNNVRIVLNIRDPRDQVVAAAFMIQSIKNTPFFNEDIHSIIDELIVGGGTIWETIFKSKEPWFNLKGIADFYNLYLPWQNESNVYTTRFEKLVGPQGGGNEEDQIEEIIAIAQHMDKNLKKAEARAIAKKLFGGTVTFREGHIGSWKKYFLERHKIAFKTAHNGAGQKLLERLGYVKVGDASW
jgi:hypothetical protein